MLTRIHDRLYNDLSRRILMIIFWIILSELKDLEPVVFLMIKLLFDVSGLTADLDDRRLYTELQR